jgi:DNA-binding NarL/FixJ family response regulator
MEHHRRYGEQPDVPKSLRPAAVRLLIVADVRLYREGLHAGLAGRSDFDVVGSAATVEEALRLITSARPHVIIIDMATRQSLKIIRTMRCHDPGISIIGFGVDEMADEILACAAAGLAGYVPCEASLEELVRRVECVYQGELLCTPQIAAALFCTLAEGQAGKDKKAELLALTARERQVLQLIDKGFSNKEIAIELRIEVSTVKSHVHNLLDKLRVTSRLQATARLGRHVPSRQRGCRSPPDLHFD